MVTSYRQSLKRVTIVETAISIFFIITETRPQQQGAENVTRGLLAEKERRIQATSAWGGCSGSHKEHKTSDFVWTKIATLVERVCVRACVCGRMRVLSSLCPAVAIWSTRQEVVVESEAGWPRSGCHRVAGPTTSSFWSCFVVST